MRQILCRSGLLGLSVRQALPEGIVFRNFLCMSLSTLLLLLSLPLLAVTSLVAVLSSAAAVLFPRFQRRHACATDLGKLRPVDEFGFENALHAYEELIGAYTGRGE